MLGRLALWATLARLCAGGGRFVHSVVERPAALGEGCAETLDLSHCAVDAAGLLRRAVQLEDAARADDARARERAVRAAERERARALAATMNALSEEPEFARVDGDGDDGDGDGDGGGGGGDSDGDGRM